MEEEQKEKAAEEVAATDEQRDEDKYFKWGDPWDCGKPLAP